jgi:hypothetical protein
MDSDEFKELVSYIRDALKVSMVGYSLQEINSASATLDSNAYKAAVAVDKFFTNKRLEYEQNTST